MDTYIKFWKMNGLGNKFLILDARCTTIHLDRQQIRKLARSSISFDQAITVTQANNKTNIFMQITNADGTETSSCGNGARCVAWLSMQETSQKAIILETRTRQFHATLGPSDKVVVVNMGQPSLKWEEIPIAKPFADTSAIDLGTKIAGLPYFPSVVSMGNPHAVFFVESLKAHDIRTIGPMLETHPMFPERVNISLAEISDPQKIKIVSWERGTGFTKACGTAACAAVVSGVRTKRTNRTVEVLMRGGKLLVEWQRTTNSVITTGPVELEFTGRINTSTLAFERDN